MITLGLPVYNGQRYVAAAIESLLAQTWQDFELLISDNASTDNTVEICQSYARQDPRIRVFQHPQNRGAGWNFNFVVGQAQGTWFRWAACDDLIRPDYLAVCMQAANRNPQVVLINPDFVTIDGEGKPFDDAQFLDSSGCYRERLSTSQFAARREALMSRFPAVRYHYVLKHFVYCPEIFAVMRLDALKSTGLHRPYYGSDKMLLAEMALRGQLLDLPDPLFLWRRHHSQSMWVGGAGQRAKFVTGRQTRRQIPGFVRFNGGYVRRVLESGLPLTDQLACWGAIPLSWLCRDKLRRLGVRWGMWGPGAMAASIENAAQHNPRSVQVHLTQQEAACVSAATAAQPPQAVEDSVPRLCTDAAVPLITGAQVEKPFTAGLGSSTAEHDGDSAESLPNREPSLTGAASGGDSTAY